MAASDQIPIGQVVRITDTMWIAKRASNDEEATACTQADAEDFLAKGTSEILTSTLVSSEPDTYEYTIPDRS